jgi:hypothetical protein
VYFEHLKREETAWVDQGTCGRIKLKMNLKEIRYEEMY